MFWLVRLVPRVAEAACHSVGLDPVQGERDHGTGNDRGMIAAIVADGLQYDAPHDVVQMVDDRPYVPPVVAAGIEIQVTLVDHVGAVVRDHVNPMLSFIGTGSRLVVGIEDRRVRHSETVEQIGQG